MLQKKQRDALYKGEDSFRPKYVWAAVHGSSGIIWLRSLSFHLRFPCWGLALSFQLSLKVWVSYFSTLIPRQENTHQRRSYTSLPGKLPYNPGVRSCYLHRGINGLGLRPTPPARILPDRRAHTRTHWLCHRNRNVKQRCRLLRHVSLRSWNLSVQLPDAHRDLQQPGPRLQAQRGNSTGSDNCEHLGEFYLVRSIHRRMLQGISVAMQLALGWNSSHSVASSPSIAC